jgi:cell division protein FtsB
MRKHVSETEYTEEYSAAPQMAGRRISAFLVTVFIIGLSCVILAFLRYQYDILVAVEGSIAVVQRSIDDQQELTRALKHEKSMHGSAEYYEEIARKRLGLVYRGEIVFRKK